MIVTVKLSGYYDWEPVPADVEVTTADISARRVKPAANGSWLMRVTKKAETHTTVSVPESQVITQILQEMIKDKSTIDRETAVGHYLARHVMPHHAHKNWMSSFEVESDAPDAKLLKSMLDEQIKAGNIEPLDAQGIGEEYAKPAKHVEHLHARFGVKSKSATKAEPKSEPAVAEVPQ